MARFGRITDHAPPTEGLLEVQRLLRQLRGAVLQLVLAQHRGEQIPLDHQVVLELMELPAGTSAEEVEGRLVRAQAQVLGTTKCPGCGGAVRDLEGVTDEVCQWCGVSLSTDG